MKLSADPYVNLSDAERTLIESVFNGKRNGYDPATMNITLDKLRDALLKEVFTDVEYGSEDHLTQTFMELNVNRFGFDKSLAQVYQLNQLLRSSTDYNDFKRKAAPVLEVMNTHHLQTEYNFAIAAAQNAASYNRYMAMKDEFPYLQYQTAGDGKVRPAHAALDGKVFAIGDPTMNGIYPPNGFGCRCEMIQVRAAHNVITGTQAAGLLGEEWDKMVKGGFAVNRGELRMIFDLNTSYINDLPSNARENGNKLTYLDAGLKPFRQLNVTSKLDLPKVDVQEATNSYKSKGPMKDHAGRWITLDEAVFDRNIRSKDGGVYYKLQEVLQQPDEVWFNYNDNTCQYSYVKFYEGTAIVVPCNVQMKISDKNPIASTFSIESFFKASTPDNSRKGVLIYNK